jgi:hypothetical protein
MARMSKRTRNVRLKRSVGDACFQCGYNRNYAAMVFHHFDPATKLFGLHSASKANGQQRKDEIAKCVLLCANCHAELHNPSLDRDCFMYMDYEQEKEPPPARKQNNTVIKPLKRKRGLL